MNALAPWKATRECTEMELPENVVSTVPLGLYRDISNHISDSEQSPDAAMNLPLQ
jgi:hypothetical protein